MAGQNRFGRVLEKGTTDKLSTPIIIHDILSRVFAAPDLFTKTIAVDDLEDYLANERIADTDYQESLAIIVKMQTDLSGDMEQRSLLGNPMYSQEVEGRKYEILRERKNALMTLMGRKKMLTSKEGIFTEAEDKDENVKS